ncbi:expressed unknown protein [Seminavis robusta]|uniref:Uncharacterized protein n=1 Tax=Seminavis robusta TaxID=568900 RepID=A0A9N8EAU6_9STRA|nr:expressed unknown protein [Seminavis robusta]|eukprot:Sro900_g217810.1 n/a (674) ;mRNA; f:6831-8973
MSNNEGQTTYRVDPTVNNFGPTNETLRQPHRSRSSSQGNSQQQQQQQQQAKEESSRSHRHKTDVRNDENMEVNLRKRHSSRSGKTSTTSKKSKKNVLGPSSKHSTGLQQPKASSSSSSNKHSNSLRKQAPSVAQTDKENGASTTRGSKSSDDQNAAAKNDNNQLEVSNAMLKQHRNRLIAGGQIAAGILTPHNNSNNSALSSEHAPWGGFVRKGTMLKTFLDDAMQHVATGYAVTTGANKRQRVQGDENSNDAQHEKDRDKAVSDIAKDKTKELVILQQKLEESQAQVAALTASNETLREETSASALRFERTIEALKIAAANAASARTDADQAEVSAEGLATQLEALKIVVEQTKQAAQVLHEEQEEISKQARNGQAKLLQVETELARSQKETKQLREQADEWQKQAKELQEEATDLKRQLADQTEQTRKLTTALEERDALEVARKERNQQVEQELREAQELLVNVTSAAANSETLESLNEGIEKLQAANKNLHEQLVTQQETAREDKERLRESLLLAEKDAQSLRIEASLQNDQHNDDDDNNSKHTLTDANSNSRVSPDGSARGESDTSFSLRMPSDLLDSQHAVPPATTCSVCFKDAYGLMKSCQCGNPQCDKRAHITCANRINPAPSVSHPGTPAAKLPVVLCSGALAGILKNRNSSNGLASSDNGLASF